MINILIYIVMFEDFVYVRLSGINEQPHTPIRWAMWRMESMWITDEICRINADQCRDAPSTFLFPDRVNHQWSQTTEQKHTSNVSSKLNEKKNCTCTTPRPQHPSSPRSFSTNSPCSQEGVALICSWCIPPIPLRSLGEMVNRHCQVINLDSKWWVNMWACVRKNLNWVFCTMDIHGA